MDFSSATKYLNVLLSLVPEFLKNTKYEKYIQFWPIFLIGFLFALFATPVIGKLATKYDVTDKPGQRKRGREFDNPQKAIHEGITPTLGGLAITIPILIAIPLFFKLDSFTIPILLSLLVLTIGATLDDVFVLSSKAQLFFQVVAAGIIALSILNITSIPFFDIDLNAFSYNFSIFGIQQSLSLPGDLILFFWLLVCINAVKWTAGSPGIIEANSLVIFSLIFIISVRYTSIFSSTLSILATGGLLIFLFFAFPPQKIFTGSSGKSVYGFLICILAIVADTKLSTTAMLLILPLVDFLYVIVKRYITYKPKSLGELMKISGLDHLHHQLIKLNLSRKHVVLIETSITLLLGSFAILATGAIRYFALTISLSLGIAFIVYINIKASKGQEEKLKKESPESKYSY
ncbi:undecaprenyl/decaprenyl-phosphate alpha-N-acetylglucosaminyl 1-phosphate transferase [Candidatus Dojkabacteria bacterium]|jgi:UDP-N-acetylmuramyl pentapeptide phosphotransferase/UDP-N-acetylglucosamine-1-phosphate transferase|nr:MraY family glycosyltransferase [Bacteroidales bacterium]NLB12120.1 undecaprenyl/decaprenyl-phosphate alpha-N-acetylglucosaminyl 1-phosphate transferase [Candidatus Dojkabacteria bacterium]